MMKYCTHCGKEVCDEAVVCTSCGCKINSGNVSFCYHCGNEILPDAVVCINCGCPVHKKIVTGNRNIVSGLSEKIKINGIIWLCIAGVQIILGIAVNWICLIIGLLNLFSGISDINFSKEILKKPVGIVKKIEPLTSPIITLVYNVIFGGVIGVAGSIYYLVAIRNFVLENKEEFLKIEADAL